MIEVKKTYLESLPALRLIGIPYTDADKVNGSFGAKWGEWFSQGKFEQLEALGPLPENEGAYMGMMPMHEGTFEYWIGMLFPRNVHAPEGYKHVDIPAGDVAIVWIYGREDTGELYGQEPTDIVMAEVENAGWKPAKDGWFFERYNCPRFTEPDDQGKVILDYGVYVKGENI